MGRPVPKPSHNRRVPKRGDRSKFSKMVRDQVKEDFNNQCAMCFQSACHVHHVMPRSRSGRNVYTNALLLCNNCHKAVHAQDKLLRYWIKEYKKKYGPLFFMDKQDLEAKYLANELKEHWKEVREWKKYNA